ncbi:MULTISPECIES: TRAP transporter permease [unclassified Arthrobacter]|uniref:TRAP transporter permease n=1 Tax=unclassified Arthrobacter TaxID=235627 RepID=UPI001E64C548|nr:MULTISPECIES: TRAP transporter permease [unclassified Arthrobacter]MCC9146711.1 TRAP transporter permease [Arthrobacter sp. zg-Y919]MDK1277942.1 TRAP transporter permease [Arthrobacter sp. zg.Y919]WIB03464.1 TRAP transporter permease [Arthrobacter sp. zg-Y919]
MKAETRLTPPWRGTVIALTLLGVLLTMNQVFFWNVGGLSLLTNAYLYLILAVFLPVVFIVNPVRKVPLLEKVAKKAEGPQAEDPDTSAEAPVRWFDVALMLVTAAVCIYLAVNGTRIKTFGWEYMAPDAATVASFLLWLVALEALRRTGGLVVTLIALIFSLYPLVAKYLPIPVLQGVTYDLPTLAQVHVMGAEGILGLPLQTAGTILIGFLIFGVALQHTGGADFFHNLSMSIFGRYRGGAAKVSVASSAAMGMMSGSAVSNVLTTGPMTIPAMKRSGFSATYAGGVEATASSGGSITPPIMGTAAFLMVSFVGVPYTEILVAATIPAFLYFLGIYLQVDGYSARNGLKGAPVDTLPRTLPTLLRGWPYVLALVLLTGMLFITNSETKVPYWVILFLLLVAVLRPGQKFGFREFTEFLVDSGKTLSNIIGIIAGVGLIVGGLTATGVSLSLARELVALVGDNVVLILIAGAITCFILGMGMTISAAYVFLAIVMVPAVVDLGVNPLAAHLFVIYWASVSYITPPVGLAAFAAAGLAKAPAMATSIAAMKLGAVKYVVPFGFALNPALVAQDSPGRILLAFVLSIAGVYGLASAIEGWVVGFDRRMPIPLRLVGAVGGFLLFLPTVLTAVGGIVLVAASVVLSLLPVKAPETETRDDADPEAAVTAPIPTPPASTVT